MLGQRQHVGCVIERRESARRYANAEEDSRDSKNSSLPRSGKVA